MLDVHRVEKSISEGVEIGGDDEDYHEEEYPGEGGEVEETEEAGDLPIAGQSPILLQVPRRFSSMSTLRTVCSDVSFVGNWSDSPSTEISFVEELENTKRSTEDQSPLRQARGRYDIPYQVTREFTTTDISLQN